MDIVSHPDRSHLMEVLWDIQRKKRCIAPEDISKISQLFDISTTELEGIISFYHFFHFKDVGKYTIYLNNSIISEFSGRKDVKIAFEEAIGVKCGHVTADKMFGLFETPCIGLSDMEPACLINFKPFINLNRDKVFDIIQKIKSGKNPSEICDEPKSTIQYTPTPERTVFLKPYAQFSVLTQLEQNSPEEIIEIVKQSKLAGRGGAFFSTGLKWQFCRKNEADQKYMICNADEGEPGTFKDRVLMQEHPELLIEGMIIAAYAVGATQGAIYLRAEYRYLLDALDKLLDQYRSAGFLGKNIPARIPFDFDMNIHLGAGAYVCGEETALIHSMEGKRGEPGTKEYFPVQKGFKGKPTVVNNVETLSAVTRIFEMGVEKWLQLGTEKTPGTKLLSVSGDCKNKGIFEVEWGMEIDAFLKIIGLERPRMLQLSGPSGECFHITEEDGCYMLNNEKGHQLSGEDIPCGGSVMIFNEDRNVLEILKSYSDFFVAESCGICVPCRTGNFLMNKKLDKIIKGHGEKKDLEDLISWAEIIKTTSRCGLGQMSNNTLIKVINTCSQIFDNALAENTDINKAFDLDTATKEYDSIINEINQDYE